MLETIQQSATPHDQYQIEFKLDYELAKGGKTHYRISNYIFIPKSLGINEESYPKSEFYRDIKNYIRIKTPELSLRDLIESDISPLNAASQICCHPFQTCLTKCQISASMVCLLSTECCLARAFYLQEFLYITTRWSPQRT